MGLRSSRLRLPAAFFYEGGKIARSISRAEPHIPPPAPDAMLPFTMVTLTAFPVHISGIPVSISQFPAKDGGTQDEAFLGGRAFENQGAQRYQNPQGKASANASLDRSGRSPRWRAREPPSTVLFGYSRINPRAVDVPEQAKKGHPKEDEGAFQSALPLESTP